MPDREKAVMIATRGSRRLHTQISELAKAEHRTISNYLRLLLKRVIPEERQKRGLDEAPRP